MLSRESINKQIEDICGKEMVDLIFDELYIVSDSFAGEQVSDVIYNLLLLFLVEKSKNEALVETLKQNGLLKEDINEKVKRKLYCKKFLKKVGKSEN